MHLQRTLFRNGIFSRQQRRAWVWGVCVGRGGYNSSKVAHFRGNIMSTKVASLCSMTAKSHRCFSLLVAFSGSIPLRSCLTQEEDLIEKKIPSVISIGHIYP